MRGEGDGSAAGPKARHIVVEVANVADKCELIQKLCADYTVRQVVVLGIGAIVTAGVFRIRGLQGGQIRRADIKV